MGDDHLHKARVRDHWRTDLAHNHGEEEGHHRRHQGKPHDEVVDNRRRVADRAHGVESAEGRDHHHVGNSHHEAVGFCDGSHHDEGCSHAGEGDHGDRSGRSRLVGLRIHDGVVGNEIGNGREEVGEGPRIGSAVIVSSSSKSECSFWRSSRLKCSGLKRP